MNNKINPNKIFKTKIINQNSSYELEDEENIETKRKAKKDNKIQNNDNLSLSEQSNNGNFNQVLFNYKDYQENALPVKRKSDLENELKDLKTETDNIIKQKKQGWIAKNQTKITPIKLKSFIDDEVEKNYSQNEENNTRNKKKDTQNKLEDSYRDSLDDLMDLGDSIDKKIKENDIDSNSNLEKKEKKGKRNNINENLDKSDENTNNNKKNMSKYQEYLYHKNQNNNKIKDYEVEYKAFEDQEQQTYDDFYKMKHNNRKIIPGRNNNKLNEEKIKDLVNNKNKKEREKMKGHKCELCQKFYECVNEEGLDNLCQECSRHRTNEPINKTPQGFYDLTL